MADDEAVKGELDESMVEEEHRPRERTPTGSGDRRLHRPPNLSNYFSMRVWGSQIKGSRIIATEGQQSPVLTEGKNSAPYDSE